MPSALRVVVCLFALAIVSVSNVSAKSYSEDIEDSLYQAVSSRMGIPYRWGGTDDRGYDCSGFVWRVMNDAGIPMERASARDLWATLPEASAQEQAQFGTLVFFRNLGHVGIVRDGNSFYHASTSQGVTVSSFHGYWGSQIVGFRRASAPRRAAGTQRLSERRTVEYRSEQRPTEYRYEQRSTEYRSEQRPTAYRYEQRSTEYRPGRPAEYRSERRTVEYRDSNFNQDRETTEPREGQRDVRKGKKGKVTED